MPVGPTDGASSITVAIRVRPFTIHEAAQLTKCDEGPLFLGDGSLAAVPAPKLARKGIKPVIKVVDDKCLYGQIDRTPHYLTDRWQSIRSA